MMNSNRINSVYKCERCGNLFADVDLRDDNDIEKFKKRAYIVRHRSDGHVTLCPECLEALTEFMQRPNKAKKEPDLGNMSAVDIQRLAIQMLVDKAWAELKKTDTDGD